MHQSIDDQQGAHNNTPHISLTLSTLSNKAMAGGEREPLWRKQHRNRPSADTVHQSVIISSSYDACFLWGRAANRCRRLALDINGRSGTPRGLLMLGKTTHKQYHIKRGIVGVGWMISCMFQRFFFYKSYTRRSMSIALGANCLYMCTTCRVVFEQHAKCVNLTY